MEIIIPFKKITAVQNEVVLSYLKVRGLNFLAVIFCGDYSYYLCIW